MVTCFCIEFEFGLLITIDFGLGWSGIDWFGPGIDSGIVWDRRSDRLE